MTWGFRYCIIKSLARLSNWNLIATVKKRPACCQEPAAIKSRFPQSIYDHTIRHELNRDFFNFSKKAEKRAKTPKGN